MTDELVGHRLVWGGVGSPVTRASKHLSDITVVLEESLDVKPAFPAWDRCPALPAYLSAF